MVFYKRNRLSSCAHPLMLEKCKGQAVLVGGIWFEVKGTYNWSDLVSNDFPVTLVEWNHLSPLQHGHVTHSGPQQGFQGFFLPISPTVGRFFLYSLYQILQYVL